MAAGRARGRGAARLALRPGQRGGRPATGVPAGLRPARGLPPRVGGDAVGAAAAAGAIVRGPARRARRRRASPARGAADPLRGLAADRGALRRGGPGVPAGAGGHRRQQAGAQGPDPDRAAATAHRGRRGRAGGRGGADELPGAARVRGVDPRLGRAGRRRRRPRRAVHPGQRRGRAAAGLHRRAAPRRRGRGGGGVGPGRGPHADLRRGAHLGRAPPGAADELLHDHAVPELDADRLPGARRRGAAPGLRGAAARAPPQDTGRRGGPPALGPAGLGAAGHRRHRDDDGGPGAGSARTTPRPPGTCAATSEKNCSPCCRPSTPRRCPGPGPPWSTRPRTASRRCTRPTSGWARGRSRVEPQGAEPLLVRASGRRRGAAPRPASPRTSRRCSASTRRPAAGPCSRRRSRPR